jgi:hypothetical protein
MGGGSGDLDGCVVRWSVMHSEAVGSGICCQELCVSSCSSPSKKRDSKRSRGFYRSAGDEVAN